MKASWHLRGDFTSAGILLFGDRFHLNQDDMATIDCLSCPFSFSLSVQGSWPSKLPVENHIAGLPSYHPC